MWITNHPAVHSVVCVLIRLGKTSLCVTILATVRHVSLKAFNFNQTNIWSANIWKNSFWSNGKFALGRISSFNNNYKMGQKYSNKLKFRVGISSTFSVLRPLSYPRSFLYIDLFTSPSLLRCFYFKLFTSASLLRPLYFDILSNLDFLLVEKHRSKYSFGRSKVLVEVKF